MSFDIPLPETTYNKKDFHSHLDTVISSIQKNITKIGINNPKIGISDHEWKYCGPSDWVSSFWVG